MSIENDPSCDVMCRIDEEIERIQDEVKRLKETIGIDVRNCEVDIKEEN